MFQSFSSTLSRIAFALFFPIFLLALGPNELRAQSNYEKGWEALDNAEVNASIEHFEDALKDDERLDALLSLALIHTHCARYEKAASYIYDYFKEADDPYPVLYALWFDESVIADAGKKTDYQLKLLKDIMEDPRNKGKLDAAALYRFSVHYIAQFDGKNAAKIAEQIGNIESWSIVGPFDNVMNSGFDKDFGPLENPAMNSTFKSKYNGEISWYVPSVQDKDGYFLKDMYFFDENAIVYAQTFVESDAERDVLLKFGYSGSLKLWLNDSLIYSEASARNTEMDYFRYKVKLNKGANRILLQLGDYQEAFSNFTLRFTDLQHTTLNFPVSPKPKPYDKSLKSVEQIPYFVLPVLTQKVEQEEVGHLYRYILANAYKRSRELDQSQKLVDGGLEASPKNFLMLRQKILLTDAADDATNQNLNYEDFKLAYPHDIDILKNEIERYQQEQNLAKMEEYVDLFNEHYDDEYMALRYELELEALRENYDKVVSTAEKLYSKYPDDYYALSTKYGIVKYYNGDASGANKLLEGHLKSNYNYDIIQELLNNYFQTGEFDKAYKLLDKNWKHVPYDIQTPRQKVNLLSREMKYDEALALCKELLKFRPTDYRIIDDIAVFYQLKEMPDSSLHYYKQSLEYFPFSYKTNKKILELEKDVFLTELIPPLEVDSLIADFNENFETDVVKPYTIVYDRKVNVVFKSSSKGYYRQYLARINDEKGIDELKQMRISPSSYMDIYYSELKTVKADGKRLDADRSDYDIVFTNLEVGDFVLVEYYQEQIYGGKSSVFVYDKFGLNSYYPVFNREFSVMCEPGMKIDYLVKNGEAEFAQTKNEVFDVYTWSVKNPTILKSQPYNPPFSDLGTMVHFNIGYDWDAIVDWYSDLSAIQAQSDYTIENLVAEMEKEGLTTDEEKFEYIYELIRANIRYSSVDFRQGSQIPQKASDVYHSRLGDCKDVSTLFVSLAREAGLKANLVLVNTRNNGQQSVILPSLNFNHCIVRTYPSEGESKYLELTDTELPYGFLDVNLEGAAVLEIPASKPKGSTSSLAKLERNKNYENVILRRTEVFVNNDLQLDMSKKAHRSGVLAAHYCESYCYKNQEEREQSMRQSLLSKYESNVILEKFEFESLGAGFDTVTYLYDYTVTNDVLKVGSHRAFKIPFSDQLASLSIFNDEERINEFEFGNWERTDLYEESVVISLDDGFTFDELPESKSLNFNGNEYEIKFSLTDKRNLLIERSYRTNRERISTEEFSEFKEFISEIFELENTQVTFKVI